MELTGIYIYPVKSLRGVRLEHATLENGRLPGDREWIVVDPDGQFMHQRDYPQMARVDAANTPDGLTLSSAGLGSVSVRRPDPDRARSHALTHVQLWRRAAPVVHASHDADRWLTEALGVPCHLLAFAPGAEAFNVPDYEVNSSLQDATPFHLTSEDSLADLNARMDVPIPMNRFRPNLVVRGAAPYAEDDWKHFAIGIHTFRWIKPCTRCVMTTTDQETGARHRREPLYTLSTYRRLGSEVVFGHYVVAETLDGPLRVGDQVRVAGSE
jgi:uncharacterized protein YcbX